MKVGIVTFPGSNCDYDAYAAVKHIVGEDAVFLWHKSEDLQNVDLVLLPGGFSYGDYLRAGAIARFSPIMGKVVSFARSGGMVLIEHIGRMTRGGMKCYSWKGCPGFSTAFSWS